MTKLDKLLAMENTLDNFKLSKLSSKSHSAVNKGASQVGILRFLKRDNGDIQAIIDSTYRLFNFLRTSPIRKVISITKDKAKFETQGGVYLLERVK